MSYARKILATLLLCLGLLGSGAIAAQGTAAQATPGASPGVADQQCVDDQNESGGEDAIEDDADDDDAEDGDTEDDDAEDGDTEDDDAEDGGTEDDDAEDGDTEDDDAQDGDTEEDDSEDGSDTQDDDGAEQESANATPGSLTQGQDLLPLAKVTVEDAIATAQGEVIGDLGSVELEERDGTLVYEVTIGDQEVFVDAATGAVVSVEPVQNADADCENEAEGAAGTLIEGADLLPQATITLEKAITTAQGAATGDLGTLELEIDGETLVFIVEIGDQEVTIDAKTGEVLYVDQDN